MKVLFLSNIPSPYRVSFFTELGKSIDLTVLFERKNAADRDNKWISGQFDNFNGNIFKGIKVGTDKSISFDFLNYIRKNTYDIIVLSGYSSPTGIMAILYCQIRNIPYVICSDGAFVKKDRWYKKALKNILIGKAKAGLCTGAMSKKYLMSYGLSEKNIHIYPFTSLYDRDILKDIPSFIEKLQIRLSLGMNEGKIIIAVGRYLPVKGYDVLMRAAMKVIPNTGLYIIGGVPTREMIDFKANNDLKNIHFISFMTGSELKFYYMAADIFVMPTRGDVWGLVVNEAMACGLPVVSTDKSIAALEMIDNDVNGYIVPSENSNALAEKICYLLMNNEKRIDMAINNLDKIRNYTFESMAKRHLEIFSDILPALIGE